jgi:hypothetical protein
MATNEEHTPRILRDESDTRYIELSTQFEQDVYWHPSVTITLAAFTDRGVMLHRMKSEETAVRFDLSTEEMQALITGYTAFVVAGECRTPGRSAESLGEIADPLAFLDDHPF